MLIKYSISQYLPVKILNIVSYVYILDIKIGTTMNYLAKFAVLAIAAGLVIGTTSMTIPVAADKEDKENAQGGLNRADENIHENTDSTPDDLSDQDVRFHEGICQGGHSTDVLDVITKGAGCDALDDPGGK